MSDCIPPLMRRALPLVLFGYAVAALRLGLDFYDREVAMYFGIYYVMPVAYLYLGSKRFWGLIGWKAMAGTMMVIGALVWGVTDAIVYSIGQFMEWTDGRFYPGERILAADGTISYGDDGRAFPPAASVGGKLFAGLAHGAIASVTGGVWSVGFGTLFVWVPKRSQKLRAR